MSSNAHVQKDSVDPLAKTLVSMPLCQISFHNYEVALYNKHTCREVSPGLDAPRVAGSFPNSPSEAR